MSDEEYFFDDLSDEEVVGYGQVGQVSYTHSLLNESGSDLSKFAEKISVSINNVTDLDGEAYITQLNQILNFIESKSKELDPIYYKNSDMFVIGFLCLKANNNINQNQLKYYSKNYNINDIIRYLTYIKQILL